jgi:hypothetical protein
LSKLQSVESDLEHDLEKCTGYKKGLDGKLVSRQPRTYSALVFLEWLIFLGVFKIFLLFFWNPEVNHEVDKLQQLSPKQDTSSTQSHILFLWDYF